MKPFIILTLVLWAADNCASLNLGRIMGGRQAEVGEAPYIVQLRTEELACSGALIYPNWVLTAAHCLTIKKPFDVFAGLHAVNGTRDPEVQYRHIPIKYYITHKYYADVLDSVDLGLIYITPPFDVEKSARVKTIAMSTGKYELPTPGKAYGWGMMDGNVESTNLRAVDVSIESYEQCWDHYSFTAPIMIYNICSEGPAGPCYRDAGGPLVHDTPEGVELVGIVSFGGVPCDSETRNPIVYINVSMFPQWISNATRDFVVPS